MERNVSILNVPSIPTGLQVCYYHALVTIHRDGTAWIVTLSDPFGLGESSKTEGSEPDAKQHALSLAHGYLTNTYADMNWPVLRDDQIHWREIVKKGP